MVPWKQIHSYKFLGVIWCSLGHLYDLAIKLNYLNATSPVSFKNLWKQTSSASSKDELDSMNGSKHSIQSTNRPHGFQAADQHETVTNFRRFPGVCRQRQSPGSGSLQAAAVFRQRQSSAISGMSETEQLSGRSYNYFWDRCSDTMSGQGNSIINEREKTDLYYSLGNIHLYT